ncbi:MAG: ATP-binding cassette domain-containing protein [Actinobacteria bacterium]|nr:ATP-binding cassette domain-containing protein [Actinomycetota bacterium]
MTQFAIQARDIVRTFRNGEVRALDGVSLNVPVGQVFGLLGPNGSGKTTMVRILATILAPDAGSATVDGKDVVKQADAVRRSIGLAGQYATVDENLTGFENIRMVARLNHMDKDSATARAHELLAQFSLTDAANRTAKTYSGGMRRRLDLAAALVAKPPVLFLDEPTTGLDPQSRQDLWEIIEGLVATGVTVLLTTQYLEEADRLASQLVVLDKGKIIAEGTPASLKAQLGTTVVAVTFENSKAAHDHIGLIRDLTTNEPNIDGAIVELTVNSGPQVAAEVIRRLDTAGVLVAGLALREPSLDDVFLNLTGHKAEDVGEVSSEGPATRKKGRR